MRLPKDAVKIYDACLNIKVERYGKEVDYSIPVSKRAAIYGLQDGTILIRARSKPILKGNVKFRGYCVEIKAKKGKESLWPGELFKHDFKEGSAVYSTENGDILIRSLVGKKLWDIFNY